MREYDAVADRTAELPPLIPQPVRGELTGAEIPVGRLAVTKMPSSLAMYEDRINETLALLQGSSERGQMSVRFEEAALEPEEYHIQIRREGITISTGMALGALQATRTLVDLWDTGEKAALPEGDLVDRPTFRLRGVFAESIVGTDRMTLDYWKVFLDRMGQLKFNVVGLSIYGCWDIHHGERSEYLFTPLDDFPELKTPRRMVTWDPETAQEVELRYVPRIFEENLFGEIAAHAARQGIEVIPHLGGPGHSTLIPRLMPALSAVDEEGNPTGYGYCVTRTSAREVLALLVRALARQHLVPNQIVRLHVAGDEYYPIRNVDPGDRTRVVSPYCRCAGCRELTPGQLLMEYLLLVGHVLAEYGVAMVHWQDTLVREGVLDEYLDRVDAAGLHRPTIAWWKYNDPVPTPDALRTETWSCPTTGFAPFTFQQDFLPNIENVLRRGREARVDGVFAYGLPDPADHMNYAALADLAWNLDGS
ncbi:glycoside hydrolase family 20 zincin-like fold domain-containing protein, partial [Phytoactinopolyspora endophytica]|uniref:glycoside hydrolase family 20 zincin-like fold domain-containing protein n=1 Tax=Phytoactinopolyspora endophytica TaxID=1642495 RepID=UPI0013EB03E1